ncbi:MAG: RNA 2',3'-cyclic phosphodiesterase [Gammaproteobacteria bacterium]|nr:RNA 2',3'-cyclic phosphodiesterase [Gammaproteobacteria bacterium]
MDSETTLAKNKRIFLALWPDENTRQQLVEAQKKIKSDPKLRAAMQSARLVQPDNLHMTLHFIGSVPEEVVQSLQTCLDAVHSQSFSLSVKTAGCFPKPRVFWLGLKSIPPELNELEQIAASCVEQCVEGYRRIPYRPHISLFRKVKILQDLADVTEIRWQVDSFALVESKTYAEGVQYHVLRKWSLTE